MQDETEAVWKYKGKIPHHKNYCEAAKHVAIPAKFQPCSFQWAQQMRHMYSVERREYPHTREKFFSARRRTSMSQLQGCKAKETFFFFLVLNASWLWSVLRIADSVWGAALMIVLIHGKICLQLNQFSLLHVCKCDDSCSSLRRRHDNMLGAPKSMRIQRKNYNEATCWKKRIKEVYYVDQLHLRTITVLHWLWPCLLHPFMTNKMFIFYSHRMNNHV